MKSRDGFVSNSSSSSFLILGVLAKDAPNLPGEDRWEWADARDLRYLDEAYGHDSVIGKPIGSWDDSGVDSNIGIQAFLEGAAEVAVKLGVTPNDLRLIGGTYYC